MQGAWCTKLNILLFLFGMRGLKNDYMNNLCKVSYPARCGTKYGLCVSGCKVGFLTTLQVFVGFVASVLLTVGAMILGYLTMSLPEGTLTDFDHKTAESFASS